MVSYPVSVGIIHLFLREHVSLEIIRRLRIGSRHGVFRERSSINLLTGTSVIIVPNRVIIYFPYRVRITIVRALANNLSITIGSINRRLRSILKRPHRVRRLLHIPIQFDRRSLGIRVDMTLGRRIDIPRRIRVAAISNTTCRTIGLRIRHRLTSRPLPCRIRVGHITSVEIILKRFRHPPVFCRGPGINLVRYLRRTVIDIRCRILRRPDTVGKSISSQTDLSRIIRCVIVIRSASRPNLRRSIIVPGLINRYLTATIHDFHYYLRIHPTGPVNPGISQRTVRIIAGIEIAHRIAVTYSISVGPLIRIGRNRMSRCVILRIYDRSRLILPVCRTPVIDHLLHLLTSVSRIVPGRFTAILSRPIIPGHIPCISLVQHLLIEATEILELVDILRSAASAYPFAILLPIRRSAFIHHFQYQITFTVPHLLRAGCRLQLLSTRINRPRPVLRHSAAIIHPSRRRGRCPVRITRIP